MIHNENYVLSNGVEIPKLALGTWMIGDDDVAKAVVDAVELGYRHIDTAQAYQNESGVGKGIRDCGVPREQLFITTKLAAEIKSFDEAVSAIDGSLEALGLETIDLMLIHSPQPWRKFGEEDRFFGGNREAWRALEQALEQGKVRAIGVSNFEKQDLDNLLENGTVAPMVNQVLAHISNTPEDLITYSHSKGMVVEAYSPLAHGELMKNDAVSEMAERYGVSIPQLAIRYDLQLGTLPIAKSTKPGHMKNNADLDFTISDADMTTLRNLPKIEDYGDASGMPVFGGKLS